MLRIGLVSRWNPYHADEFAEGVLANERATIAWVWDENPEQGQAWAARLGVPCFEKLEDALDANTADGVILNAHPMDMARYACMVARHRLHVLADKIVATDEDSRRQLASAFTDSGLCFATALPLMARPHHRTAAGVARSRCLGNITLVRLHLAHGGLVTGRLPAAFVHSAPGGIYSDMGFHGLYLLPWLAGAQPVEIAALGSAFCGGPAPDTATWAMRLDTGALGVAEAAYTTEHSPFALEVYGDAGCLYAGGPGGDVQMNTGAGWTAVPLQAAAPTPEADWIDAIESGRPPAHGLQAGLVLSRRFQALLAAAKNGRAILAQEEDCEELGCQT